ncbi:MAG: hypothetical protein RBR69_03690 [Candidatus Cloacimonadaceae bacterium]|jgi:hypothetical protein|nr:hypothetical protein [Candidatus Cloacimonadota bacterium]MDY0127217.1 hypothetical protein [Candidatus Cloacimonadaceae bacterium]MCB5254800.1 hypothetical protein [Candidatus Cloacimonadota bacterium]MCK9178970.1 hypothetical protein [Candidatus Cloacimonadota bacterium]MCK9243207.1 hypothetical protein [Candidatus Cloacimonadota bacterium]
MRVLICFVILSLCLPLLGGTFIPLSCFEDASINDLDVTVKWGTLLNLGNCVYEEALWYDGGVNNSGILMPQLQVSKGLTENLQMGLQAFVLRYHDNNSFYASLNLKRRLHENDAMILAINPLAGYSRNRYILPFRQKFVPNWSQRYEVEQDSQAFFAQLPLLLQLKKPAINCCLKLGYARFAAEARYKIVEHNLESFWENIDYGSHDIINGGINFSYPIRISGFVIRPELGYELFSLVKHNDKFGGSLTGGLAFSFDPPRP